MGAADGKSRQGASDAEIRQFELYKANTESMVHRLRDWEDGDVIFGYDVVSGGTSSTGKTFTRDGHPRGASGVKLALEAMEVQPTIGDSLNEDTRVYAWVARIESVSTEPRDPMDPGEPPLKFADLRDVAVIASRSGANDD